MIEDEASLSGDDIGSDQEEGSNDELNEYEPEEGDKDDKVCKLYLIYYNKINCCYYCKLYVTYLFYLCIIRLNCFGSGRFSLLATVYIDKTSGICFLRLNFSKHIVLHRCGEWWSECLRKMRKEKLGFYVEHNHLISGKDRNQQKY